MGDWFTSNAPATTGAKPAGDWFAQNAPAPPKPETNHLKDALHALWEWTGKPALALAGPAIPGLNGPDSSEKSLNTLKGMIQGLANEGPRILDQLDKAGTELFRKGNFERFAHHVAGAAPVVGAPVQQIGSEVEKGEYGKAGGHTAALFAPFVAKAVPPAVSDVVDATATAVGGAVKGAAKAAVTPTSLVRASPVEAVTAALGSYLGKELGLPGHVAGGLAGRMAPQIIKAGYRGGKTALAERAATKAATANDAALAADASKIPPDVMAELTRESGVPEAPAQEAPSAAARASDPAMWTRGELFDGNPVSVANIQRRFQLGYGAATKILEDARAAVAGKGAVPQEAPVEAQPTIPESRRLEAGPQVTQLQAPPDPSFVKGVPAEYPQVEQPQTIAEQIQAHVAAKAEPMIGAHKAANVQPNGGGNPLRPPLKVAGVEPNPSTPTEPIQHSEPAGPALEQPRSTFSSNGEPKSPQLRAAEIKGANTTAKAKRFAGAMSEKGVTAEIAEKMQAGRVSDAQIGKGAPPRWGNLADFLGETEPNSSVPEIIAELRKMEAAKPAPTPVVRENRTTETPAKSPRDMTRAELAKQAGLSENATTEQIMKALADAMEEEKPKTAAAGRGKK